MTDETKPAPRSLGMPNVEQCKAIYRSMIRPTTRGFHMELLKAGYNISEPTSRRFINRHIKKLEPKQRGDKLSSTELTTIQTDLAELKALDANALRPLLEKEVLIYSIMLMRFSQRSSDRLAMSPKDSAAMVKSMTESTVKPMGIAPADNEAPVVPPIEQNEVSNAISLFMKRGGAAA